MKQTKIVSLIEVCASTAIGFAVALIAQIIIFPLYGMNPSMSTNIQIVIWFTIISVARGYVVRRLFENGIVQTVVNMWYSARVYFFKKKRMKEVQNTAFQGPPHLNCRCSMVEIDEHNRND